MAGIQGIEITGIVGYLKFKTLKHCNNSWLQNVLWKYSVINGPIIAVCFLVRSPFYISFRKCFIVYFICLILKAVETIIMCYKRNYILIQVNWPMQLLNVRLLIGIFSAFNTSLALFLCTAHFYHGGQSHTSKPEVHRVIRVQSFSCFPVEGSRIQTSSIATAGGNISPSTEPNRKDQMDISSIYFVTIREDVVYFFHLNLSIKHSKHIRCSHFSSFKLWFQEDIMLLSGYFTYYNLCNTTFLGCWNFTISEVSSFFIKLWNWNLTFASTYWDIYYDSLRLELNFSDIFFPNPRECPFIEQNNFASFQFVIRCQMCQIRSGNTSNGTSEASLPY